MENERLKELIEKLKNQKPEERDAAEIAELNTLLEGQKKVAVSRGVGDTIKKVTDKLGIKQCGGCKARQKALNKMFPYKVI